MTNAKTTRKALLSSSMSILLCVSMLIGSTFAWFTDTASTGLNKIMAGNLDVELRMYDGNEYVDISNDDKPIFGSYESIVAQDNNIDTLWEPGKTQVAYLMIRNAGSLALKYQVALSTVNPANSNDLYKVMEYQIVPDVKNGTGAAWTAGAGNSVTPGTAIVSAENVPMQKGDEHYFALLVHMDEEAGNEYMNGKVEFDISVLATQLNAENDSFGPNYDASAEFPDVIVYNATDLQNALDSATEDTTIALAGDITEDIKITQKSNVKVVIDGDGHEIAGAITLDGKSSTITTAGAVIQNVNFKGNSIDEDACIRLGDGTNATRYICNLTVKNCTFDAPNKVGVKSYTGGDKNISIIGCTATANAHSLAQLKGVDGVLVENCTVNSVRGINFNNSDNITVIDSTFDAKKYAVRFGESGNSTVENYAITNCTLSSENVDGDATIVLRAGATNANLTLTNTTINGNIKMTGHENANVVIQ